MVEEGADAAAVERLARRIGFAGAVPFVTLSLWLFAIAPDHPWRDGTIALLKGYGAVVMSFLGGARFGLAIARAGAGDGRTLLVSMLPPLLAWVAFWMPVPHAFAVLAGAFAAHGAWDAAAVHRGAAPGWYGSLRTTLTFLVVAALVLALFATA